MYCGRPIDPNDRAALPHVEGHEERGGTESRRGGSDIILRRKTGKWGCGDCILRLKSGLSVMQESLEL
jgi:hypothetical protein